MTMVVLLPHKTERAISQNLCLPLPSGLVSSETNEIARRVALLHNPRLPSVESPAVWGERPLKERLFDVRADVKRLISQVTMHLSHEWRHNLFVQIDSLHDPDEWEAGDEPVNLSSFFIFLKAIVRINPVRRPSLGLSYTGNLIAAWTASNDRLTIEFLNDGRVRWVLTRYCSDDDEPEHFAGQTGVAQLLEGLAPYHPEKWFSHGFQSN